MPRLFKKGFTRDHALSDYAPPPFLVDTVDLEFDLDVPVTSVRAGVVVSCDSSAAPPQATRARAARQASFVRIDMFFQGSFPRPADANGLCANPMPSSWRPRGGICGVDPAGATLQPRGCSPHRAQSSFQSPNSRVVCTE